MGRYLALAVHVQREPHIPGLRKAPGLVARVLVVPPPLVHHQHAGTLARRGVVPGEEPLQHGVALAVFDLTGLHGGAPWRQGEQDGGHRESVPSVHAFTSWCVV